MLKQLALKPSDHFLKVESRKLQRALAPFPLPAFLAPKGQHLVYGGTFPQHELFCLSWAAFSSLKQHSSYLSQFLWVLNELS